MRSEVASAADTAASLYQRLGGADGIAAIVDDVIDRHAVNPALALRFAGKDLPKIKRIGAQLACAGTGGPQARSTGWLRSAYAGLAINQREFLATMEDILAALHAQGVAPPVVNEIVAILFALQTAAASPERACASQPDGVNE
jgi:hemoglobin